MLGIQALGIQALGIQAGNQLMQPQDKKLATDVPNLITIYE